MIGEIVMNMSNALKTGVVAVFAALHVTLYLLPFPSWRNWAVFLLPIEGIILGPSAGFFAAFLGSGLGRIIKPDDFWMFGIIAEPLGVLASGFLAKGKWKPVMAIYLTMFGAYFIHPLYFGQMLPLWTIVDIPIALILIYPAAKFSRFIYEKNSMHLTLASILIFFVGTIADSLTRVFLFIPARLYELFGLAGNFEALYGIFVLGATQSFVEDGLAVIISILIGVPLIMALRKATTFEYPLT